MTRYLLKRLVYAVLVIFAVSLLTFLMSRLAPGDLVQAHLTLDGGQIASAQKTYSVRQAEYTRAAERLGLHLPGFYISIHPLCFPDTLHRILRKDARQAAKDLLYTHGDWASIEDYRKQVLAMITYLDSRPGDTIEPWISPVRNDLEFLLSTADDGRINYLLQNIAQTIPNSNSFHTQIQQLSSAYGKTTSARIQYWQLLPTVTWHGMQNQYHQWMSKTLSGDFGRSLIDGRPVKTKIADALRWTLGINVIAILLAFGIAIPLGVWTARRVGKWSDKTVSTILFAFYAIPSFWLAMLSIVFLTTSEYGKWLDVFPTGGVGSVTASMAFVERAGVRISHLTLPVLCIMAGSLAYLTKQMRGSMLRELRQDYIRMARAKGLSENVVFWKHAFRNALFPMITMVGSAFPAAISGAVILEVIFSIPGMGRLMYMSILSQDWPVVYAMVLFAACLTIIGYLVSDLLYRWADPRVELQTRKG